MQRLLPVMAILAVSAQPALAGSGSTQLPTPSILGLAAVGVIAAIYLVSRKR